MTEKKDYRLSITTETYSDLQEIAAQEGTTLAGLLRRAIKLFLTVQRIKTDPDARLLVEQSGQIREIITDLL